MRFGSSFLPISFFIIWGDLSTRTNLAKTDSDAPLWPHPIHQMNEPDTPVKFAIWRTNSLEYHKALLCIVVKTYTQAKTLSYPQLFNSA